MRYEIRPMSFGEILDAGFRVVRDHAALLIGIASVVYLPLVLFMVWLEAVSATVGPTALILSGIPLVLFILVAQPVIAAAITFAVGEIYLGRTATFGASLRAGAAILLPLIGTALLTWIFVAGGLLLFVIPGIYLALAFLLVWQVMVLERTFGMTALRRSRTLMQGNLLRAVGIVVVGALIVGVLGSALQFVFGYVPIVGALGSGLAQAAGSAYTSTVGVILYFDIRCRKEAFDVEHLAQLVAAEAPESAPAGVPPPIV